MRSFEHGKMYCFSKCCRLCLTKNNTLVNIKRIDSDGVSFLDKLELLAPLVANPRNYMNWICEQCRKQLKKAYMFIQHCFKSNAVLEQYCKQLTSDDTAQNKCTDSEVSEIQFTEIMIKESNPRLFKEECFENLPAIDDDQYYIESTITVEKHEVSSTDFQIKLDSPELKQEAGLNVGDASTSSDEIVVPECDHVESKKIQINQIAGTSGENNISSFSDVPNETNGRADSKNMNSSNSLIKHGSIKSRKPLNIHCYKCRICNKTFTYSVNLRQHEKIHSGERPFKCSICDKKFALSSYLKKHERVHSGERSYTCKICNKTFTYAGNLEVHERVHSGARPFKCEICSKTFTFSGNLKSHETVHTGACYKCKICNKSFSRSSTLKKHKRVHSDEPFFNCKICNKTFTQSIHLKQHEAAHSS